MLKVPGQHTQDALHILLCDCAEGIGTGQQLHDLSDRIALLRGHGHQMLGQNIQTEPGGMGMLNSAPPRDLCGQTAV